MTRHLTNDFLEIDKNLFDHTPTETITQIISYKTVFDRILNRDVHSIFDPTSMGHKFSDREQEILDHDKYNDFLDIC